MADKNTITRRRVVLDVDDVMWDLNGHVAWLAGIDIDRIITFHPMDNFTLTDEEKKRLNESYQVPWLHERMDFYPDAALFAWIAHDDRIEPWIASNNTSPSARDNKLENLHRLFGDDLDLFTVHMPVVDMSDTREKTFPEDIWCLIDDSPMNAVRSGARHVLMPRRPWNQSEAWGAKILSPIWDRIQFYGTLTECMLLLWKLMAEQDARDASGRR